MGEERYFDGLCSEMSGEEVDILLVFEGVEGAGAVDEETTVLKCRPHVGNYRALEGSALFL